MERIAPALAQQRSAQLAEVALSLPPTNQLVRRTALAIEISVLATHDPASTTTNATTLFIAMVKRSVQAQALVYLGHFLVTTGYFAMDGRLAMRLRRHADQCSISPIALFQDVFYRCNAGSMPSHTQAIAISLTIIRKNSIT